MPGAQRIKNLVDTALAQRGLGFGNVFFVSSTQTGASDSAGRGLTPETALATIDYAVGRCTASQGDVIVVLPGHAETLATTATIAADVAGVSIIGFGNRGQQPAINITGTAAGIVVTSAGTHIENILVTGGVDAIVAAIGVQAADCTLRNVELRDVTGQMTLGVLTTAAANRLTIDGFVYNGATAAGGAAAIRVVGGDGTVIRNFRIFGNFSVAAIENVTTAATNLTIGGTEHNYIQNGLDNAAVVAVTLVATTTGFVGPNINARIGVDATSNTTNITEAFVGAAAQFMQPLNVCNLGGEVAMQTNITASTDA